MEHREQSGNPEESPTTTGSGGLVILGVMLLIIVLVMGVSRLVPFDEYAEQRYDKNRMETNKKFTENL